MERAPLSGYRAVSESETLAGRLLARHLADMGAEVAVIESPDAAALLGRTGLLRNTFSADASENETRAALLARADVIIVDEATQAPLPERAVVVAVPAGIDEGTDLPWLLATAAAVAVAAALYRLRKQGMGARIELRADALASLLDAGGTGIAAGGAKVGDPRHSAHLRARGFFEPVGGEEIAASPWLIGGSPAHARTPAPRPGEHTEELRRRFTEAHEGQRR